MIIGSILMLVAWLLFITLYALSWSTNYDFFQNAIVAIASFLITGLAIGAMWLFWYHLNGVRREPWSKDDRIVIQERRSKKDKEVLDAGQRAGEVVTAATVLLILAFYVYHQVANTGFFTSNFGGWEIFAFYGSIILSLVSPMARAAIGRRNPVRPVEAFSNIFFALAFVWLLEVFPFNFAHFAAALPEQTRFMFFWISNDIARIAFVLIIVGNLASAIYNVARYVIFRSSKEKMKKTEQMVTA